MPIRLAPDGVPDLTDRVGGLCAEARRTSARSTVPLTAIVRAFFATLAWFPVVRGLVTCLIGTMTSGTRALLAGTAASAACALIVATAPAQTTPTEPDPTAPKPTEPVEAPAAAPPAAPAESTPAPPAQTEAAKPAAGVAEKDLVELKDGTIVRGRILRLEPGKFVVIRGDDGGEQTFAWDEIKRTKRAGSSADEASSKVETSSTGFVVSGSLDESEARRQAWLRRGGSLVSYEVRANATGILLPEQQFRSACVGSRGVFFSEETSPYRGGGGGGGLGGRVAYMNLALPKSGSTWTAFRVGTGVDLGFTYVGVPVGFPIGTCPRSGSYDGGEMRWEGASLFQMAVPVNIGGHLGLGGFGSGNKWSGVVVGVAYAPSFSLTKVDKGDAQTNFNWAGFELTLDVTSLEAAVAGYSKPAHFRLAFFVLPPVKSDMPLIGSVSFGAVWY